MKKSILIGSLVVLLTACGGSNATKKEQTPELTTETKNQIADVSTINVYYFHGKQRCKTCIAVGNVAEETVKSVYANHPNVKFIEVKTEEKQNEKLVEKYEVTWNALIIAKGLTKQENIMEIMKYNVMTLPAVVADGEVKIKGHVPSESEIRKLLDI